MGMGGGGHACAEVGVISHDWGMARHEARQANYPRHLKGSEREVQESVLYPLSMGNPAGTGTGDVCFRNIPQVAMVDTEGGVLLYTGRPIRKQRTGVQARQQHQPQEVKPRRQRLRDEGVAG